jgi:hypothetical protein
MLVKSVSMAKTAQAGDPNRRTQPRGPEPRTHDSARRTPDLLDHPFDHPDDPTGPIWIRLDRRGPQREQARSVWSRPDRRRAPGYGSGGLAMAVLADAAPCAPVPGRTYKRQWTVVLSAIQQAAAAASACPRRRRGCSQCRPPASCRCPQAASTVHTSGPPMSAGCADLAGTQGARATGHRGSVRWTCGIAAKCWPDGGPLRRGHGRGSPKRGGDMAVAGGRPSMHPAGDGS